MNFTKQDLVKALSEKAGISQRQAHDVLDSFVELIGDELAKNDKIRLTGFGTFEVRSRAARKGRNPRTGEEIEIPATRNPAFRPGKELKAKIVK